MSERVERILGNALSTIRFDVISGDRRPGDFWQDVNKYLSQNAPDRRYRVRPVAASIGAYGPDSTIVWYMGERLYCSRIPNETGWNIESLH